MLEELVKLGRRSYVTRGSTTNLLNHRQIQDMRESEAAATRDLL